jgi:hypothetical protein
MRQRLRSVVWVLVMGLLCAQAGGPARAQAPGTLVIGTQFDYFTVNGKPKFLIFTSYFDGLRPGDPVLDSDFAFFVSKGINGVRIFPNWWNWSATPTAASDTLIDSSGNLRAATLTRLKQVLDKAKTYGLIVDLSFSCETVASLSYADYRTGLIAATQALSGDDYRHVFFDLQNESWHLGCAGVPVTDPQRTQMRNDVKTADPLRLVTASLDPSNESVGVSLSTSANLDMIAYHDPRVSNWYALTGTVTTNLRSFTNCASYIAATANSPGTTPCKPVYLQEPDYIAPTTQAYIDGALNAKFAGAAAYTFHTRAAHNLLLGTAQSQFTADQTGFMNGFLSQLNATAWEGDDIMETWRTFYGVTTADQDSDGVSNLDEFRNGTHPTGSSGLTRYFVEGVNSTFYGTRLALVNPGVTTAPVLVRFLKTDGTMQTVVRSVAGQTRQTLDVTRVPGLREASFSTVIETPLRVVIDRTVGWDRASDYGGHAERNIIAPSTQWYFAEGSTAGGFDLFYILKNPNPFTITIQIKYLLPSPGAPLTYNYTLAANAREVVAVDGVPGLSWSDVSSALTCASPFLAERIQYYTSQGRTYNAGGGAAPVSSPGLTWYFAEGASGAYFSTYLLLANPNATAATVQATYRTTAAATVVKTYTIPANSRFTIGVDGEDPALAATSFWTTLTSTNGVSFVADRSVWWPDPDWHEVHNSAGESGPYANWALAEGEIGGATGKATYVLVANTSGFADTVGLTVLLEGGGTLTKNFAIGALGRLSIDMAAEFPGAANQRFGTLVRSAGGAQLVVERSMYWNAGGVSWANGTNAFGTKF